MVLTSFWQKSNDVTVDDFNSTFRFVITDFAVGFKEARGEGDDEVGTFDPFVSSLDPSQLGTTMCFCRRKHQYVQVTQ